jgi:hypothetical protein
VFLATVRAVKLAIEAPLVSKPLASAGKPTMSRIQPRTCFSTSGAAWLPPPRFGFMVAASRSASAAITVPLPMYQAQKRGWVVFMV